MLSSLTTLRDAPGADQGMYDRRASNALPCSLSLSGRPLFHRTHLHYVGLNRRGFGGIDDCRGSETPENIGDRKDQVDDKRFQRFDVSSEGHSNKHSYKKKILLTRT